MYIRTDNYLGRFLPYLDEDWTIIVTSGSGLSCQENLGVESGKSFWYLKSMEMHIAIVFSTLFYHFGGSRICLRKSIEFL